MKSGESGSADTLSKAEWALALAMTAFSVALHIHFRQNAGGMWRDEVDKVQIATFATWADV